jgi:hypothetical protein
LEPARAGISATTLQSSIFISLQFLGINIYNNIFQVRVNVQGFRSGLPRAIAGLLQSAKRHMGFAAESAGVDDSDAGLNLPAILHGPVEITGMNTSGKTIGRVVGQLQCFVEINDAV